MCVRGAWVPLTQWPFHDPGTRTHAQMLLVIDVQKGIQTQTAEVGSSQPCRVVAPSAAHVWSLTYACCGVVLLVLGVSAW